MIAYNVDDKIDKWFWDRGITSNGKPMAQAIKTLEETTELLDAINKNDVDEIMDAVGDIYVTLRGVCLTQGIFLDDCIDKAYNEIKDRKGHLTPEGTFVKET
jgi:NTP pyrophosphatase (non-canonical NTP hydrolase)